MKIMEDEMIWDYPRNGLREIRGLAFKAENLSFNFNSQNKKQIIILRFSWLQYILFTYYDYNFI